MKTRAHWCSKSFYDSKKFPYGFSRSGIFTYKESELLESKGHLLQALVNEEVFDPTPEDLVFVRAFKAGDFSQTFETQVWWKYISYQRNLISIAGSWIQSDRNMQAINDDDFVMDEIDTSLLKEWDSPDDDDSMLEAC